MTKDDFAKYAFPMIRRFIPSLLAEEIIMGRRVRSLEENVGDVAARLAQPRDRFTDGTFVKDVPMCFMGWAERGIDVPQNKLGTLGFDDKCDQCLLCPHELTCSNYARKYLNQFGIDKSVVAQHNTDTRREVKREAEKRRQKRADDRAVNAALLATVRDKRRPENTSFRLGVCGGCGMEVVEHLTHDPQSNKPCAVLRLGNSDMRPDAHGRLKRCGIRNVQPTDFRVPRNAIHKAAVILFYNDLPDSDAVDVLVLKNRWGDCGGVFRISNCGERVTMLDESENPVAVRGPSNDRIYKISSFEQAIAAFGDPSNVMESRVAMTNALVKLLREFFVGEDMEGKAEICDIISRCGPRSPETMKVIGRLQREGRMRPGLYKRLCDMTVPRSKRSKRKLDKDRDIEKLRGDGSKVNERGEYSNFDLPDTYHPPYCKKCGHARGCMCPRQSKDPRHLPPKERCRHTYALVRTAIATEMGFEIDPIVDVHPGEVYVCTKCRDDGFYDADNQVVMKIKRKVKDDSQGQS